VERLAGLAGLDPLAAERPTGIGPGAAPRRVEGRGTARHVESASPGSSGLMLAPLATVPASRACYLALRIASYMNGASTDACPLVHHDR
jgi:hypothetical protein